MTAEAVLSYLTVAVTTRAEGALGLAFQPAGDGIAAGIPQSTLICAATIAGFAFVDDAIAAGAKLRDLVGFVQEAESPPLAHPLVELLHRAGGELVGLDPLLPNDGGPHQAAVPVGASTGRRHHAFNRRKFGDLFMFL